MSKNVQTANSYVGSGTTDLVQVRQTGNAQPRAALRADGSLWFSDGTNAPNRNLYWDIGGLKTDNDLYATNMFTSSGFYTSGDVQVNNFSIGRGVVAKAAITSNAVTVASTTPVDITGVTASAVLVSGRTYKITVTYRGIQSTVAAVTETVQLIIAAGGTAIADVLQNCGPTASSARNGGTLTALYTAASGGVVTFKLQMARFAGTGTVSVGAAGTSPIRIIVEDIGV